MEIRFISSLTAEDENQFAPALLKAVGVLLDQLPIAYTMRIQTTGAQVFQHTHTHDAPPDPNFYGAARLVTDESGSFELRTVKPGAYPVPTRDGWWRPPHVHFSVWGRVWLSRLVTQMFFPGEPLNEADAILMAIRDPGARRP